MIVKNSLNKLFWSVEWSDQFYTLTDSIHRGFHAQLNICASLNDPKSEKSRGIMRFGTHFTVNCTEVERESTNRSMGLKQQVFF